MIISSNKIFLCCEWKNHSCTPPSHLTGQQGLWIVCLVEERTGKMARHK